MKIIKKVFDTRELDIYSEYKILTDENREKYIIFYISHQFLASKNITKEKVEDFLDTRVKEIDFKNKKHLESIVFCTTPEGGERAKEFIKSEFSDIEQFTIKYN